MSKIKREVITAAMSCADSSTSEPSSVSACTTPRTSYPAHPGSEPLAFVLHDLQTPVAVLELSLALLDGDLAGAPPETHATLRDAQRAARRVREYIDHFVSSEIFGEATLRRRRRRVELRALLKRLVEENASRTDSAGVALDLELPSRPVTCIRADEIMLERLFQNLLDIFVESLAPGGRVAIRVQGGSVAELRLSHDCGTERSSREFADLLCRLTDPAAHLGQLGLPLGLRVCQQVIAAHAGTMAVEDPADGPLCLVVRLPAASL